MDVKAPKLLCWLCCKNAGRKRMDVKAPKLLCLDGYSKQFSDECCLA